MKNINKGFITAVLFAIVVWVSINVYAVSALNKEVMLDQTKKKVDIKDRNDNKVIRFINKDIEVCVRSAIGRKYGNVYKNDIEKIKLFTFWNPSSEVDPDVFDWSYFTNLEELHLEDVRFTTMSNLCGLKKLKKVVFTVGSVNDLSGLQNVEEISLFSTRIGDAGSINKIKHLKKLDFGRYTSFGVDYEKSSNIIPKGFISELSNLEELSINETEIENPDDFRSLKNLQAFSLYFVTIHDLSSIFTLKNLKKLTLEHIEGVNNNSFKGVRKLNGLEELGLNGFKLKDINFLSTMTNLRCISLAVNNIEDIRVISGLYKLNWLDLSYNHISDIKPLNAVMKKDSTVEISCNKLDLRKNSEDLQDIQKLISAGVKVKYD